MKAAVLFEYEQPVQTVDVELMDPKPGEVLIKIAAAGVCHSDLHVIKADLPLPVPIILGHEGAGVVEAVGEGVTRVQPGDHVVLSWVPECGECYFCKISRYDMCDTAAALAISGAQRDGTTRFSLNGEDVHQFSMTGTFAEYTTVPQESAIPIRKDVPLELAALVGCGVMTGVGAVINTAKVRPGSSVVVIGAGGVGLNVIQGAALAGAEKIIAVDLVDGKLSLARTFGATHTINAKEKDVVMSVLDYTDQLGAEYAFEVIGRPETIAQAYNCLRKTGTAVVVGVAPPNAEVSINAFSIPSQAKTLTGTWYGQANPRVDLPRLLDLYKAGKLKLDELMSKSYDLSQINEAFQDMVDGKVARGIIKF
ncbi:Zn-dependent alcohol dehydrogenase [Effusibacillus consociatus]|uniref:Zn-dependent alcohol dehydrogenase n=1 Tax=Effusibacillus consociatus TaxID=1117041 RepID=A0ABV9Q2C8_9BACL